MKVVLLVIILFVGSGVLRITMWRNRDRMRAWARKRADRRNPE